MHSRLRGFLFWIIYGAWECKRIEMFLAWALGCLKLEGVLTCVQILSTQNQKVISKN